MRSWTLSVFRIKMAQDRVELPTHGASIRCSTNWATAPFERPWPDLNRRSPPWQGGVLTATLRGLYVVQLRGKDSNLRPPGYEPDELPTALPRDNKIGKTGFEPTTPWSQTKCSTKLSYFPQLWCFCSTHPRGVEPLTAWFVVKYSIQLSYGCFIAWLAKYFESNKGKHLAKQAGTRYISGRRDSNPRPPPWQGDVLPLNYFRIS